MIWSSGGSKSRLAKAAGAEPAGQMRDEKLHAVVARSTFRSQNVKNTRGSDHFWMFRCRKSARRCGAKHISKSNCTKHTILGPLLEVEMSKKCTPLWREAHFQVKMYKTHQLRTTFGSWDVEKVHAVVARSTFPSQNVKNTPAPDHFWMFRCRKSARRCGAKHISKSKCTKHTSSGPLLEVEISKKCTPLWRKAHFQAKMYKTPHVRATFGSWDVEKVHAVVARSTFPSQNVQNTPAPDHFWMFRCRKVHAVVARFTFRSQNVKNTRGSDHFWRFRCRFVWQAQGHKGLCTLSKVSKTWGFCSIFNYNHHYTTLHSNTLHSITLNYTTLHYTTLHSTTHNYTPLHWITLHNTLHSTTLHYTTLHYTTLHDLPLHFTTLHYTTLHWMTLHHT